MLPTAEHARKIEDLSARARKDHRAFARLRVLAGQGDALVQYVLAAHLDPEFQHSRIVKPNIDQALHW